MAVEKAFAIQADPGAIWDALWSDLISGQDGAYALESSHRPESLALQVELGGLPFRLTYRLNPMDEFCEVSAELEPLSMRYSVYQFLTFGHLKRNLELVLVTALSNLKQASEDPSGADALEEWEV